ELQNILDHWVRSTDPNFHVIPTDTVYVTIDKEAVRRSGMMMASDSIPDRMVISLKGKAALYKGDLMMLEMIAHANWERPIYVALTVGQENYMNLGDNFVQEGLANRITPFTTNAPGAKNFDTEKTFNNVMKKFKFGNVSQEGIYLDETVMRMCYTHRRLMSTLALKLAQEGKTKEAQEVLAKCEKELPATNVPHDFQSGSTDMVQAYILTGQNQKAQQLLDQLWKKSSQYLQWYLSLDGMRFDNSQRDCMLHLYIMNQLYDQQTRIDDKKAEQKDKQLETLVNMYHAKGGSFAE
ncbi:MAG: tetratricopeptide repeat protein, partial [Prevotella sp.]|nr:tetratricopeptide repeat protein [Prevotella sp.]